LGCAAKHRIGDEEECAREAECEGTGASEALRLGLYIHTGVVPGEYTSQ